MTNETPHGLKRIDPRRTKIASGGGVPRVALSRRHAVVSAPELKPLRRTGDIRAWIMAVAYADRGTLDDSGRQALAAAAILADGETGVLAVVLGALSCDLAPFGADGVITLPLCDVGHFDPERDVAAVSEIVARFAPRHIILADSPRGEGDLGRRLAVERGASVATHVVELDRAHVAQNWNGGAVRASAALPAVVLLAPGVVETDLPYRGDGRMLDPGAAATSVANTRRYRDLGIRLPDRQSVALEEADAVVSAGNGVKNDETIEQLAEALGAAVGASRVAVDDGRYPRARQIGASGKTVQSTLYVAVGISGAIQHLQGIKDCRHVIAINRDGSAPIVKRADLTVVGDAEDIMQSLILRMAQAKAQRQGGP
ncbi:MAG: electron transfer flavoprotein subunit alpha/FixB family protein [Hyphomicrobium sp.]|nr:electron transfer flavoprotein subunit alpha/FixB family protein [Hyphomicrobium sp.]